MTLPCNQATRIQPMHHHRAIFKLPSTIAYTCILIVACIFLLFLASPLPLLSSAASSNSGSPTACKEEGAIPSWHEDFCCPDGDFSFELNPFETGPLCTHCRFDEHRCGREDEDGSCCGQDQYCVRDANHQPRCSSSPPNTPSSDMIGLMNRTRGDIHLSRNPTDRHVPHKWTFTDTIILVSVLCGVFGLCFLCVCVICLRKYNTRCKREKEAIKRREEAEAKKTAASATPSNETIHVKPNASAVIVVADHASMNSSPSPSAPAAETELAPLTHFSARSSSRSCSQISGASARQVELSALKKEASRLSLAIEALHSNGSNVDHQV